MSGQQSTRTVREIYILPGYGSPRTLARPVTRTTVDHLSLINPDQSHLGKAQSKEQLQSRRRSQQAVEQSVQSGMLIIGRVQKPEGVDLFFTGYRMQKGFYGRKGKKMNRSEASLRENLLLLPPS